MIVAQTFSALLSAAAFGMVGVLVSRWISARRDEERRLVRCSRARAASPLRSLSPGLFTLLAGLMTFCASLPEDARAQNNRRPLAGRRSRFPALPRALRILGHWPSCRMVVCL